MIRSFLSLSASAAVLSLALFGCAAAIVHAEPRPNIDLDPSSESLALVLAEAVRDSYEVPQQHGIGSFSVEEWRDTLEAGFDAGFRDYFAAPQADDGSGLRIVIAEAELSLVPGEVGISGDGSYFGLFDSTTVISVRASVRYKARLIGSDGEVLARSARTAESTVTSSDSMTLLAAGAVETMYEQIAADFFKPHASAR